MSRGWTATESKGVRTVRHFRPSRGDSGAAAVEFALLFPIFMILAMGLIAAGTAFSRQINVTQAVRESSRYGATYDITAAGGTANWLIAVDQAVLESVGAVDNPLGGYNYRCVAIIVRDGAGAVDATRSAYREDGVNFLNTNKGCPRTATPNFGPGSKVVQTVLQRRIKFVALFINPTIDLNAVSSTPYEGTMS